MNKKVCIIITLVVMVFISISSVVYATNSLGELREIALEEKETVRASQVGAMALIIATGTLVYIILNCFRNNKQKNEQITKVSKKAICIGILIIVSFIAISSLELIIHRANNISITMNNVIVKIILILDFLFMSSVVSGIFCYRKYKEVSPMWLNLIYIIGVILLVCFVGNYIAQIQYESLQDSMLHKWLFPVTCISKMDYNTK